MIQDHVYKYFRKKTKGSKSSSSRNSDSKRNYFSTAELISLCMASSFFHNSARRMHNETEDYLMLQNSAIVNMDEFSSFTIRGYFPEYLIFTELSGKEYARGIIRSICRIEKKWIEGYLEKIENVKNGNLENTILGKYGSIRFKKDTKKKVLKLTLGHEKWKGNAEVEGTKNKNSQLKKRSKEELKAEKIRLAKERFSKRQALREDIKSKSKKLKK